MVFFICFLFFFFLLFRLKLIHYILFDHFSFLGRIAGVNEFLLLRYDVLIGTIVCNTVVSVIFFIVTVLHWVWEKCFPHRTNRKHDYCDYNNVNTDYVNGNMIKE